jgi:hypothetical protein
MIGWNRLLAGGIRDPLVGRDMLVGLTFGTAAAVVKLNQLALLGSGAMPSATVQLGPLLGVSGAVAAVLMLIPSCVLQALAWFVLIFILRVVVRRDWLAAGAFVALYMALNYGLATPSSPVVAALFGGLATALLVFTMVRFGLVALIAAFFVNVLLLLFPITSDFSVWYAGASLFALLSVAVMAAFAFRNSLAGRPLFGDAEL